LATELAFGDVSFGDCIYRYYMGETDRIQSQIGLDALAVLTQ